MTDDEEWSGGRARRESLGRRYRWNHGNVKDQVELMEEAKMAMMVALE